MRAMSRECYRASYLPREPSQTSSLAPLSCLQASQKQQSKAGEEGGSSYNSQCPTLRTLHPKGAECAERELASWSATKKPDNLQSEVRIAEHTSARLLQPLSAFPVSSRSRLSKPKQTIQQ